MQDSHLEPGEQVMKDPSEAGKSLFSGPVTKELGDLGRLVHIQCEHHLSHPHK